MGGKRLITTDHIEASKERRRAWDRLRHAKDKEKRNAARRAAHAANPERLRIVDRQRYKADPAAKRKKDMESKYGTEAYVAYLSIHNCEACGDEIEGIRKHIDHDHAQPRKKGFRGILCNACNVALGYLKEDESRILALASYINRKKKVISMKTFKDCAAQGDLYIRRVASIPTGLKKMATENGNYIVAHSETSHHHVIADRPNVTVFTTDDPLVSYLQVIEATDATEVIIEHLRNFDTHESIKVGAGNYEIRRQREYAPEGWRRVQD